MCMHQNSWIFDKRFTCGRKEKTWKGESKKEFPVGQAVTGKFALFAKLSREFGLMFLGGSDVDVNDSEPSAGQPILLWQVSALCCEFSSQHRSLDLLLFCRRSFHSKILQLVSTWGSCYTLNSVSDTMKQETDAEKYH